MKVSRRLRHFHFLQESGRIQYARIGTVWNARYSGHLIEDEQYWLTCLRYIEQNPVRASMVAVPGDYRWSSYSAHAFGNWPNWPDWLTPHTAYCALGKTPDKRQEAYRAIVEPPLNDEQLVLLRYPPGGAGGTSGTTPALLRHHSGTAVGGSAG